MVKMTCIAVDDEPLALLLIRELSKNIPELNLLHCFADAAEAIAFLRDNTVDLVLSDINMPDMSGLEFIRSLPDEHPMVIFLTAYKEHAHEGFNLDVVDYVVKPLSPDRFKKAIQKAAELLELRQKSALPPPAAPLDDHFYVYAKYQQVRIPIAEVLYIEAMGDYVKIHLEGKKHPVMTLERIKNMATRLEAHGFRRIHRSFIINSAKIKARQRTQVRIGDLWLPVGETYLYSDWF
jgi:DNA-binding LytR/AlgR family response regulator